MLIGVGVGVWVRVRVCRGCGLVRPVAPFPPFFVHLVYTSNVIPNEKDTGPELLPMGGTYLLHLAPFLTYLSY